MYKDQWCNRFTHIHMVKKKLSTLYPAVNFARCKLKETTSPPYECHPKNLGIVFDLFILGVLGLLHSCVSENGGSTHLWPSNHGKRMEKDRDVSSPMDSFQQLSIASRQKSPRVVLSRVGQGSWCLKHVEDSQTSADFKKIGNPRQKKQNET